MLVGRGIPWERISKCFFVANRVYPYLQGCGWHPLPVLLHSWLPTDGPGRFSFLSHLQTSFFSFLLLFSKTSLGCLPAQLQLAAAADRPHPSLPPLPLLLVGCPRICQVADLKGARLHSEICVADSNMSRVSTVRQKSRSERWQSETRLTLTRGKWTTWSPPWWPRRMRLRKRRRLPLSTCSATDSCVSAH